jgi:phenylalanyl-tRNA synthetase beta chain
MNASYRWLRALAPDLDLDPEGVASRLASLGFPVEETVDLGGGIRDIVLGHVLDVRPHPNADRLRVCTVDGGDGIRSVVCGAPNVQAGRVYPFAPIGAVLPGGMRISKAKLRGEVSEGMLCSERELGLGKGQDGLMELALDPATPVGRPGTPLVDALGLDDVRLDVEVTSNRPDMLSHRGIARELSPSGAAGVLETPIPGASPSDRATLEALALVEGQTEARADALSVRIDAVDRCPLYLGLVLRGVRVGPSPAWLASRLRAIGARPINNVVDATNWVLFEWGQPLHAFDLKTLEGAQIVVRRARAGEAIETLDGVARTLTDEMLVIADATTPVAVAGVMGGHASEVTEQTTDVMLECALFTPGPIRATRKALGLSTDASYRFERGVDPEALRAALLRAAEIILATAGGTVEGPILAAGPGVSSGTVLELRLARVEALLGVPFSGDQVRALLEPLGFEILEETGSGFSVRVPGFRHWDVTREVDLIEEIARRHGYDAFPDTLRPFRPGTVPDHPLFRLEDRVRDQLVAAGFLEAQTPAFAPDAEGDVEVLNPLSSEERKLRRGLLPALLRRVEYNLARTNRDVRLFELGTVFAPGAPGELPVERTHLAGVIHGRRAPEHWAGDPGAFDLWDLRGLVETLVPTVFSGDAGAIAFEPGGAGWTLVRTDSTPGDAADGGALERVGALSVVAPGGLDLPPWAGPVYAFELTLPALPTPVEPLRVRPLPLHPGVERDLALLVPDAILADAVIARIRAEGGALLVGAQVFDVYRGAGLPEGTRSVAVRLRYRAADRSLLDAEVDEVTRHILSVLRETAGIQVRGG